MIFKIFLDYKSKFYPKYKVILRLHPSETRNKYKKFLTKNQNITQDRNDDISKTLSICSKVFAHNSMVLPLANLCGLDTFNILNGRKSTIPKIYITKHI